MNRTALTILGFVCGLHSVAPVATRAQQPVFRSDVLAVTVDVSVRAGNVPILGLQAADFQLLDGGVPQRVSAVSIDAVPIDISVLVDTSSSMYGAVQELQENATQIAKLLRPVDQFRLIAFGTHIFEAVPMQRGDLPITLRRLPYGGATSFNDAVVFAMMREVDPDRRHLIVAFSDAADTMSVLSAETTEKVVSRSDGVLHLVRLHSMGMGAVGWPSWYGPRNSAEITRAAEATGGQVHDRTSPSLPDELKRVLADFRSSYLLRFTPEGVQREGWHELEVRVPKFPHYKIRARRGYFGGAQAPSPVTHVDHVMFTGGPELSGLVALLRDKFELPVVFDGPTETPPMPGTCVSFGNLCLEVVPLPPDPNAPAPRRGSLGNLALAADFDGIVDALRARKIDHFPPSRQARWTTIGLREMDLGFFIDYHDGMEARRTRFRDALERRQGGTLGVVRVIELPKRSRRVAEVRPAWGRLLGEPNPGDADVWRVGDDLAIRLVSPDDPRGNRMVVAVRSLEQAEAALLRLAIPYTRVNEGILIDRAALYGLEMLLKPADR